MTNAPEFLNQIIIGALPIVFAIVAHEVMHGVVAKYLGDDTASRAGRLTLNPIAHIDLFGTIILPAMLLFMHAPVFGYAKPVPINFAKLRNGRVGMVMVAAAGPFTNLALAAISILLMLLIAPYQDSQWAPAILKPIWLMLGQSMAINVALAIFNLLPILPLDGGRVLAGILPLRFARVLARFEPAGFLVLFLLLYSQRFLMLLSVVTSGVEHELISGISLVYYGAKVIL